MRIVEIEVDGKVKEWEGTSMPVGVMGKSASWKTVLTQFSTTSKVFLWDLEFLEMRFAWKSWSRTSYISFGPFTYPDQI